MFFLVIGPVRTGLGHLFLVALQRTAHDGLGAVNVCLVHAPARLDGGHRQLAHGAFQGSDKLACQVEPDKFSNVAPECSEEIVQGVDRSRADVERFLQGAFHPAQGFLHVFDGGPGLVQVQLLPGLVQLIKSFDGIFQIEVALQLAQRIDGLLRVFLKVFVVKVHGNNPLFDFRVHRTTSFQTSSAIRSRIG